jgi:chromate transporter
MSTPTPDSVAESPNHPQSKTELFCSFTVLALQGFGGVMAVAQRELVDQKRWLTREQFVEDWAVAQVMPGPNVVNLSMMIGGRYFGLPGALAALVGMLLIPTMVLLLLALLYGGLADSAIAQGALRGMGAVAAGLVMASGVKLVRVLGQNPMGWFTCLLVLVLTFVTVALLHWPLAWVLLGLGGCACVWAWRQLGPPQNCTSGSKR